MKEKTESNPKGAGRSKGEPTKMLSFRVLKTDHEKLSKEKYQELKEINVEFLKELE